MSIQTCKQCGRSTGGYSGEFCEDCYALRATRWNGKPRQAVFNGTRVTEERWQSDSYRRKRDER